MLNLEECFPIIEDNYAMGLLVGNTKYFFKKSNNDNWVNKVKLHGVDYPIKCLSIFKSLFKKNIFLNLCWIIKYLKLNNGISRPKYTKSNRIVYC